MCLVDDLNFQRSSVSDNPKINFEWATFLERFGLTLSIPLLNGPPTKFASKLYRIVLKTYVCISNPHTLLGQHQAQQCY